MKIGELVLINSAHQTSIEKLLGRSLKQNEKFVIKDIYTEYGEVLINISSFDNQFLEQVAELSVTEA
ncbi:hypothetical protein ACWOE8_07030 [Enterococcus avium]